MQRLSSTVNFTLRKSSTSFFSGRVVQLRYNHSVPSLIKPNAPFVHEFSALEAVVTKTVAAKHTLTKQERYIKNKLYKLEYIKAKRNHELCWSQVSRILEDMRIDGIAPTTKIYEQAINALVRANNVEKAHELVDRMKAEKVPITNEILVYLVNACKFSIEPGKAQSYMGELLSRIEQADVDDQQRQRNLTLLQTAFTSLINVYARAGDIPNVEKVFNQMKESGVSPDAVAYGAVIKAYAKVRNLQKSLDIVNEMKQNQVALDAATYHMLIRSCATPEQKDLANQYFEEMEKENIPRDQVTYGTIMSQMMHSDDYEAVYSYYERMKEVGLRPTPYTFEVLLKTCYRDGLNKPIRNKDKYLEEAQAIGAETFVLPQSDFDMQRVKRYWSEMTKKYQYRPSEACLEALKLISNARKEHKQLLREQYKAKSQTTSSAQAEKLENARKKLQAELRK